MAKVREVQSLRALAILLVAGYHYFASWTQPIDWNDLYPGTLAPLFKYTWLGVELFFMVSGFVISMTLMRTSTIRDFAVKRFLRLWPALFLALPLVFVVGNVYGPEMQHHPVGHLFGSFTLVDPMALNSVFGSSLDWVTPVLWTMWIELQFYVVAALLFYGVRRRFEGALLWVTVVATALVWAGTLSWIRPTTVDFVLPVVAGYLPWFLAGVIFHRIWTSGHVTTRDALVLALILVNESVELWYHAEAGGIWLAVSFFVMFFAIVRRWKAAAMLRGTGLVFLGEISYEFYLIHDTIGVTVITQLLDRFGVSGGAHLFGAALGLALSIALAWLIYRGTVPVRRQLAARWLQRQSEMTASL